MIATFRKKNPPPVPRMKIREAVRAVLPKGKPFKIHIAESALGKLKIVRVVTPAWKSLWAGDRIRKVRQIMDRTLTPAEQEGILRFSVLTPTEYRELVLESPVLKRVRASKSKGAKKLAAKRKAAQKAKRAGAR